MTRAQLIAELKNKGYTHAVTFGGAVPIDQEESAMSGEIVTTYYIDREGSIWKVSDWIGHRPSPVSLAVACRLTGDSERMLDSRWASWLETL